MSFSIAFESLKEGGSGGRGLLCGEGVYERYHMGIRYRIEGERDKQYKVCIWELMGIPMCLIC